MHTNTSGFLKKIFLSIILVVIFSAMGRTLLENWHQVQPLLAHIVIPLALLCVVFSLMNYFIVSLIWVISLRYLQAHLSFAKSTRILALSLMGRYIPGKVWTVMGRIYLAEQEGIPKSKSLLTVFMEIFLQMASGFFLFIVCFYLYGGTSLPENIYNTIYMLPFLLLLLHPKVFGKGLNWVLRIAKKDPVEVQLSFGNIFSLGFFYTANWLVQGVGIYCALSSFYAVDFALVPLLSGIFAFSWLVGFLALIVPSGIGVREGMMSLLLGMWVPMPIAVTLAILVRFFFTVAELIFFSLALLGQKGWRKKQLSQAQEQIDT